MGAPRSIGSECTAHAGAAPRERSPGCSYSVDAVHIASLSPEQQAELLGLAQRELAQRSLLAFCKHVYSGYLAPAHLQLLIEHLEKLERGDIRSLAVFMPPRHGKSLTAAQLFPAWFLGRHPSKHVLLTSYNQDLANTVSRRVRDIVSEESWPFPDAKLRDDSRSVENWDLNRGGGLSSSRKTTLTRSKSGTSFGNGIPKSPTRA
jgi:hypothetical protein